MLDLDNLLRSFGDEAPSGMDLEYDTDFTTLTLANEPGEERVVGDSVIPAEDPDFAAVEKGALALLERTKDLRIAVMLANASLRTRGILGFEPVLAYMRACLQDYWDSVHPQLDAEDDDDPTMRVNAVMGLTDRAGVLGSLRTAGITDSRAFGRFSLRDLQIAEGEMSPPAGMENVPTPQVISAAFQDTDDTHIEAIVAALDRSLEHVKAIAGIFDERIGSMGPDLDPVQRMLFEIRKRIGAYADTTAITVNDETASPEEAGATGAPSSPPVAVASGAPGAIHSPEDVKRAIDRIVDYYARHEPSSPVPLLLGRARRLVSADFFTIMRDMAPQGVENVALIGGIEESDD